MSSFSELPTEIIIEIASYLSIFDDTTQVNLALACRRFSAVLIDMVLKNQIMEIEKLSVSSQITPPVYNDPKYYQKPKIRTPGTAPPSEILLFDHEEMGISGTLKVTVSGLTRKELQCLRYLVSKARHLKKLVIEIYANQPGYDMQDVAFFIGTCIARPNLALHIYGGPAGELQNPFIFQLEGQIGSSNAIQANTMNRNASLANNQSIKSEASKADSGISTYSTTSFSVSKRRHKIYDTVFHQPQISALALEGGEIPFMLPIYPVVLNALSGSAITSLELKWVPFSVTLFHWGQILPCIALPRLKELTIGKATIPFPDILSLLERHPTIENLDLSNNNVIGVVKLPSRPLLQRLVSLIANSEYLLPFIEHKIRGYFPMLETLHTRPSIDILGINIVDFPYIENDLHPVYDLLSSTAIVKGHSGSFHMTIGADGWGTLGFVKWLLSMSSSVDIGKSDKTNKPKPTPLAGVRTLIVERAELWRSPEMTDRLFEWFKTFRSSLDERTVQQEGFMDTTYNKMFEVLIWTTCLQLEKLEIAGNKSVKSHVREMQFDRARHVITKRWWT